MTKTHPNPMPFTRFIWWVLAAILAAGLAMSGGTTDPQTTDPTEVTP